MHLPKLATSLLVVFVAGCAASADDATGDDDDAVAAASVDEALRATDDYNHPNRGHNPQCVRPRAGLSEVTLYYANGGPAGYTIPVGALRHTSASDGKTGELQLDPREAIDSKIGTLYIHRGGYGYENAGSVKYGFVRLGDLASRPRVLRERVGNGAKAAAG